MRLRGGEEQNMAASTCPEVSVGLRGDMCAILTTMLAWDDPETPQYSGTGDLGDTSNFLP